MSSYTDFLFQIPQLFFASRWLFLFSSRLMPSSRKLITASEHSFIRQWPSQNTNTIFFSHRKKKNQSEKRREAKNNPRIATIRILICRFIQINSIRMAMTAPVALLRNHVYRIIIFRGIYLLAVLITCIVLYVSMVEADALRRELRW